MIKNLSISLIFVALLFSQGIFAQSINRSSNSFSDNWEINYNIGFSQFYGDASSSSYFKKMSGELGLGQSLHIKKHFSPVLALGLNGYYGCTNSHKTVAGSGSAVDFSLQGGYGDVNLRAYVDFNNLFFGQDRNRRLSFFGWLGFGYGFWSTGLTDNLTGDYRESGSAVDATTDTYKKGGAIVPIGLGLNYRIADNWSVNVVGDYRTVLNDDLDVWRGGFKFDQLFFTGFGVSYHINPGFGKRKAKTRKVAPVKVEEKNKSVEFIKPETEKSSQKLISDIPIYELDFNSSRQKEEEPVKEFVPDVLEIKPIVKSNTGVIYRVQILAKGQRLSDINYLRNKYNLSEDVYEVSQNGIYRYSVGSFNTYSEALAHSRKMKNKGISDAFVVVYKDGKRISLTSELKK